MSVYTDLASAYRQGLDELLRHGESVPSVRDPSSPASGFGTADRPAIELRGHSFEVSRPSACLVDSDIRPLRLAYCFASLVWTLSASNDLEWIASYHPDARNFSDDGISLSGAFGKRLFAYGGAIDQIGAIIKRLETDPASRRTVAVVCDAADNIRSSREYPCCIGLQYFLRAGKLHATTFMRAQHGLLVLPYDAFLFMALQCLLAARLNVEVGRYQHVCGTFHIYESEADLAREVLHSPIASVELGRLDRSGRDISELLDVEYEIRSAGRAGDRSALARILSCVPSSEFSRQAQLVLLAHWLHILGDDLRNAAIEGLPTRMGAMMRRQWDSRRIATDAGQRFLYSRSEGR